MIWGSLAKDSNTYLYVNFDRGKNGIKKLDDNNHIYFHSNQLLTKEINKYLFLSTEKYDNHSFD